MTKQNAIETVTSYFEEIDTRALVLDLKTTKDAEADYEASKYLFGDQDPESEPLENHEDLLEENEKLLIEYYKKQPEEFFAEWNEGNLLLIMARDLKSITIKITKSGLNITEILERTKRIYGNVRDRYFDGDRTEDIVWFLNFITSGEPTKGNYGHVPVKIIPSTSQIDRLLQNYVNHMFFRLILSLSMKSQKKFRGSSVIQMSMKAHTNNGLTTTIGVTRII